MARPKKRPNVEDIVREDKERAEERGEEAPVINVSDQEQEITVDEARKRGALDAESVRANDTRTRIIRARREGRKVRFNGPYDERYNQAMQTFQGIDTTVSVERTYPNVAKLCSLQGATVPTFEQLERLIKEQFWDGTNQSFRYKIRNQDQSFEAMATFTFPENPEAIQAWASRMADARRLQTQTALQLAGVGVHHTAAPAPAFGSPVAAHMLAQAQSGTENVIVDDDDDDDDDEDDDEDEDEDEDDMAKQQGYWVTNGQPGSQPIYVPAGAPCPPGYYAMQATPAPVMQAPPPPPAPAPPPVGATWNGVAWVAPPPAPSPMEEALKRDLQEMRDALKRSEERDRAQQNKELAIGQLFTDLASSIKEIKQQVADKPAAPAAPVAPAAPPPFMSNVPPGAVWDGSRFVMPNPMVSPAPAASTPAQQDASDGLDTAISVLQKGKRFVDLLGPSTGGGLSPKGRAGLPPAVAEELDTPAVAPNPRKLTFEEVGAGVQLGFKEDGDIAWGPSLLPFIPRFLQTVEQGFTKWQEVEKAHATAQIEEARKTRAALDRAMQEIDRQDRQRAALQERLAQVAPSTQSAQRTPQSVQPAHEVVDDVRVVQNEPKEAANVSADLGSAPVPGVDSTEPVTMLTDDDPMLGALHVASRRVRQTTTASRG